MWDDILRSNEINVARESMVAPIATASIGSVLKSGSLPMTVVTSCPTIGILVGPPISIVLSILPGVSFASLSASRSGDLHLWIMGNTISSSFALVIDNKFSWTFRRMDCKKWQGDIGYNHIRKFNLCFFALAIFILTMAVLSCLISNSDCPLNSSTKVMD